MGCRVRDVACLWCVLVWFDWYGYCGDVEQMSDRLFEFIVSGICIAAIVAGAVFGTWALLVTMGM